MPNTKIVLNSQSDLILTGAQLLEPSGLVQGDIEGLVAQLAAIDKAAMNEASLRTAADSSLEAKIAADVSTEKAAGDAADVSLGAKIDADVSTEKAAREAAVSTEKARIDAILDASEADKDSFGEIVTLINQVDTENDEAFAGYVLSNNAALSSELVARAEGDSSLEAKMNADIKAEKDAGDAADLSLATKIDADVSTEKAGREAAVTAEAEARAEADGSLEAKMDADIKAEKDAGDAADVSLGAKIDADVSTEKAARLSASTSLGSKIDADISTEKAAREAADSTEKAAREAAVATEKARIDAILESASLTADTFVEVVNLINSVDTENDEAFAGYVLSNNAALSSELVARAEGDSSLEAKMNADIKAEKAAGDAADSSLESKINADVTAEKATREAAVSTMTVAYEAADSSIEAVVAANDKQFLNFKSNVERDTDSIESRIDAEEEARIEADSSLDTRVNEAVFNSTPGVDSMDEIITGFNNAMIANVNIFMPTRESVEALNYDSAKGVVILNNSYQEQSFMFFINGLMVEPTEDYTINLNGDKTFDSITLLGDAKTLADNGAKMVEYGVSLIEGNVSQVTSAIVDPNGEGEGEGTISKG